MVTSGGVPVGEVIAVLISNGVTVTQRPDDEYVLATATELLCVPLQGIVSRRMLQWLSETFNIPIQLFYQGRLRIN